jgi:hypothetical protein
MSPASFLLSPDSVWAASRYELPHRIKQKIDTETCSVSILWSVNGIHMSLGHALGGGPAECRAADQLDRRAEILPEFRSKTDNVEAVRKERHRS